MYGYKMALRNLLFLQTDRQTDGQKQRAHKTDKRADRHRLTDQLAHIQETDSQTVRQTRQIRQKRKDTPKVMTQAQLLRREGPFSAFIPNTNDVWAATKITALTSTLHKL